MQYTKAVLIPNVLFIVINYVMPVAGFRPLVVLAFLAWVWYSVHKTNEAEDAQADRELRDLLAEEAKGR